MGIRTTDEDHIGLYDSVTGISFGPIFEDSEKFTANDRALRFLNFLDGIDPRTLTQFELNDRYVKFVEQENSNGNV